MAARFPATFSIVLCALLGWTYAVEENFYSREYSQEMLRKLESEIFAKPSPLQPMDYLMMYVIELKQGMTVLNDTVSTIGRKYHDLWKQEVDSLAQEANSGQCSCCKSEEVQQLSDKMAALQADVRLVLEELRASKTVPTPATVTKSTARAPKAGPSAIEQQLSEAVRNYTGPDKWKKVRQLLEHTLDPSSTAYKQLQDIGPQETTPLKSTAEKGYVELLEALLDAGLPVDTIADDVWRYDLLTAAAAAGQVPVVELLLARGANTEATNNRGATPLMFAASKNHLEAVKVLVTHGADIGHRNYDGNTALDLARKRHNKEVVDYLSTYAAGQVVRNYTGPDKWKNVRQSLEDTLDPSSTAYKQLQDIGPQETTPLKSVVEKGYVELLKALLDAGLPVDTLADDMWRYDLLTAAAAAGQVPVVELLLARGANIEATNNRGATPLMSAATKNHLAAVKVLVTHGADIGHRNYDGNTALDLARKRHNKEVVDYLSAHAAGQVGLQVADE